MRMRKRRQIRTVVGTGREKSRGEGRGRRRREEKGGKGRQEGRRKKEWGREKRRGEEGKGLLPMRTKFGVWHALWCTLTCHISSGSVYYVAHEGRKKRLLSHFQLQHDVLAPPGGAQPQTFA